MIALHASAALVVQLTQAHLMCAGGGEEGSHLGPACVLFRTGVSKLVGEEGIASACTNGH